MKIEYPASFRFEDQSCISNRTSVLSSNSPVSKLNSINSGLVRGLEIKLPVAAAKILNLKNLCKKSTVKNPKPNDGKTPVNAPSAAPEAISFTLDFSLANLINLVLILVMKPVLILGLSSICQSCNF